MEGFLMKEKQAHVMSLLSLPDPSLHYSLELKYACYRFACKQSHTHIHNTYMSR